MRLRQRLSQPSITFESFGVIVHIVLSDAELGAPVQDILPPGWREATDHGTSGRFSLRRTEVDSYTVTVGEESWLEGANLDVALGLLDAQIRLYIAATTRDWVFVHAGVVAQGERAVVLPGQSFAGKTTLVKALVEAGATYYSDEYAVLDDNGRVHPYPRRLSVRTDDGNNVQELHVRDLGGVAAQHAANVCLVAVTRYRSGATWTPRHLSPGRGVAALMANAVPAQARPQETLQALTAAVDRALILESERGEAAPVALELLNALRQASHA